MSLSPPFPGTVPKLLDGRRVRICGVTLLAAEVVLFIFIVAGTYGLIVPLDGPTTTDFVSFYAAGRLVDAGSPELVYDQEAHYAAEQRATANGVDYNFFYYPPVFLLLCAALARWPYLMAFVLFEAATLTAFLFVARRIWDEEGWAPLVLILAFPPVFWTIGLGQNALLTAALFGAATILVDRRPILAGLLFGALCYKPHLALLVPVALIAGGRWRALGAAAVSAVVLALASLTAFGWATWSAYLTAAAASHAIYESGRVAFGGFVTPFGGVRLLGGAPALAYLVQAVATAAAAALVAIVWFRKLPLPIRAAALASATLVAVPLALVYDLMLAGVAGLWLLRAEGDYRLPEWGRWVLAGLFIMTLNSPLLKSLFDQPGSAVTAMTRTANPSGAAATRMIATASPV